MTFLQEARYNISWNVLFSLLDKNYLRILIYYNTKMSALMMFIYVKINKSPYDCTDIRHFIKKKIVMLISFVIIFIKSVIGVSFILLIRL